MNPKVPSFLKRALLATALLSAGQAFAADSVGMLVYNAQHESLTKAWVEPVSPKKPGFRSPFAMAMTPKWATRSCRKARPRRPTCSSPKTPRRWCWSTTPGCSHRSRRATLEQVDAAYRPAHGKWVGIAARSTVFVYNPSKLAETDLPKSLLDLAEPELERPLGCLAGRRRLPGHRRRRA